MFVAYMDRAGNARATVKTYVLALRHFYRMADMADPTTKFWVKKVVDAAVSKAKISISYKPITSWPQQHSWICQSIRHL